MEKKPKDVTKYFKMPHLFREDLSDIEGILKKINPQHYKIETKDFDYKSIEEIPLDSKSVSDFSIWASIPSSNCYISLKFSKFSSYVSGKYEDDHLEVKGAVSEIIDIVSRRERRLLSFLGSFWTIISLDILNFVLIFIPKNLLSSNIKNTVSSVIWTSILIWGILFIYKMKKPVIIELVNKKSRPSFLLRNKDQLMIGIIVAIITVIVTVPATLFFGKLFGT